MFQQLHLLTVTVTSYVLRQRSLTSKTQQIKSYPKLTIPRLRTVSLLERLVQGCREITLTGESWFHTSTPWGLNPGPS
jgi:hypothetical protein